MNELYIGLMSGTSMDAINAALIDFSDSRTRMIGTYKKKLPDDLRNALSQLCQPGINEIERMSECDHKLGHLFADATLKLLTKYRVCHKQIRAIGSHGQTIRHRPLSAYPFSLQIGNPNIIAEKTGITTIADFRRRDIACGGEGAPLVVAFHEFVFGNQDRHRVILNLGGIANVTKLPAKNQGIILGFDTGPANALLDSWIKRHLQRNYDKNGVWSKSGICNLHLLKTLLNDSYFKKAPPKSTGREYFHLDWLQNYLNQFNSLAPQDVQATLLALTTHSVIQAIKKFCGKVDEIVLCGGGTKNLALVKQLTQLGKKVGFKVISSSALGLHPDWIEAAAFAWLAKQSLHRLPGNAMKATGAKHPAILGGIYPHRT